jgi:hypothetical protein
VAGCCEHGYEPSGSIKGTLIREGTISLMKSQTESEKLRQCCIPASVQSGQVPLTTRNDSDVTTFFEPHVTQQEATAAQGAWAESFMNWGVRES